MCSGTYASDEWMRGRARKGVSSGQNVQWKEGSASEQDRTRKPVRHMNEHTGDATRTARGMRKLEKKEGKERNRHTINTFHFIILFLVFFARSLSPPPSPPPRSTWGSSTFAPSHRSAKERRTTVRKAEAHTQPNFVSDVKEFNG